MVNRTREVNVQGVAEEVKKLKFNFWAVSSIVALLGTVGGWKLWTAMELIDKTEKKIVNLQQKIDDSTKFFEGVREKQVELAKEAISKEKTDAIGAIEKVQKDAIEKLNSGTGRVLQVVAQPLARSFTTSDPQWQDVSSLSVTPRDSNSQVVVSAVLNLSLRFKEDPQRAAAMRIVVSGDENNVIAGNRAAFNDTPHDVATAFQLEGVHKPGTTRPLTYKLQASVRPGTQLVVEISCPEEQNLGAHASSCSGPSVFKAMEIQP